MPSVDVGAEVRGAGGNVGAEAVTRAPADGYTLHVFGPEAAINATLYDKLNFNFIRDIAPITTIAQEAGVIVLNPSVPAKTVPEFIAYANSNPGKVNMASGGIGTLSHVLGEQFKLATGVKMVHVPYRGGGPAATDLIAGQVQVEFASTSPTIGYIRAGTLRALAVTTATRSEALPDIPAVAEFLPGYEATFWRGIGNQLLMRKPEWARQRAGEAVTAHDGRAIHVPTMAQTASRAVVRSVDWEHGCRFRCCEAGKSCALAAPPN
jgi:tripartite-type tricarboxylate transporter receptor subunit TctC